MSEHLSLESVSRYFKRLMPPQELIAVDDHLSECDQCRERLAGPLELHAGLASLCQDLDSVASPNAAHLSYEQIEAYLDGQLDDTHAEVVTKHLESCQSCLDEVVDLQEFCGLQRSNTKLALPSLRPEQKAVSHRSARSSEKAQEGSPGKLRGHFHMGLYRYRQSPKLIAGTAGTAILALTVTILFVSRNPSTTRGVHSAASSATTEATSQSSGDSPMLETPAELVTLIGKGETLLGARNEKASFGLLAPLGTFVESVQPTFRWSPLAGAREYKVTVFASDLNQVEASPPLHRPIWTSALPLKRGETYLWQVTALRHSEQVVAPMPPAPEAKFKIIGTDQASTLNSLRRTQPEWHFSLGLAYARAGVLDEAEHELKLVPETDPNYALAVKYLKQLSALRNPLRR